MEKKLLKRKAYQKDTIEAYAVACNCTIRTCDGSYCGTSYSKSSISNKVSDRSTTLSSAVKANKN